MRPCLFVVVLPREPQVELERCAGAGRVFVGRIGPEWIGVFSLPNNGIVRWSGDRSRRAQMIDIYAAPFGSFLRVRTHRKIIIPPLRSAVST